MGPPVNGTGPSDGTLAWLLEPSDPSPRYLTLTRVLGRPADAPDVRASQRAIPDSGPARDILMAQYPQGYWMHPGIGYSPRYRATLWQILILAQLGMPRSESLDRAVAHLFEANQRGDGAFRASREEGDTPIGLNGSLLWALEVLGYGDEPRVRDAWSWLAGEMEARRRRVTGSGGTACVWGAVKALWAANAVPSPRRAGPVERVSSAAVDLLLDHPPEPGESDPRWFRLTFPLARAPDLLQWAEVLVAAGCGDASCLSEARAWLQRRRRPDGAWPLERVPGKLWADFGAVGEPNKWITVRALAADLG